MLLANQFAGFFTFDLFDLSILIPGVHCYIVLVPLPLIPFTSEEITVCTNEAAKGANKVQRNLPSCFFISCFTVSVIPSIHSFESSNDFMILIASFISSFEMNKVNSFPAHTAPFLFIFLSNLLIPFEVILYYYTSPGKLSLAKGLATLNSVILPKLTNQEPKDPSD